MLSAEKTNELLVLAKQGDDEAKGQLISLNSPLIKSIVKRYLNKGVEYDDLFQLGAMGFVKAINNFDSSYNVKFTTYAVPMIAGEIKRFLRDDGSVKISRSIKHNAVIIKRFLEEYEKTHVQSPSVEVISKTLTMEPDDVVLALEANSQILSLNEKFSNGEDESLSLLDKISTEFSCEKLLDNLALKDALNSLCGREKQIIIMRYYMDKTQTEIAKELEISQVQISRIENKVLLKIKEKMTNL